jgi:DNA-binding response OmpR family regulator
MHDFKGLRVLVVEDESLLGMLLEEYFGDMNCVVVGPFETLAKAADAAMDHESYDMAVLDVNVHGAKVFGVAGLIAGLGKPIVFATGDIGQVPPHLRVHQVAEKPYTARDLCLKMIEALKSRVTGECA